MNNKIFDILKNYFGFDSFKGEQEAIISRTVNERQHSLVLMPTGSGKSLCSAFGVYPGLESSILLRSAETSRELM